MTTNDGRNGGRRSDDDSGGHARSLLLFLIFSRPSLSLSCRCRQDRHLVLPLSPLVTPRKRTAEHTTAVRCLSVGGRRLQQGPEQACQAEAVAVQEVR